MKAGDASGEGVQAGEHAAPLRRDGAVEVKHDGQHPAPPRARLLLPLAEHSARQYVPPAAVGGRRRVPEPRARAVQQRAHDVHRVDERYHRLAGGHNVDRRQAAREAGGNGSDPRRGMNCVRLCDTTRPTSSEF
eukprot:gene3856-biopygen2284